MFALGGILYSTHTIISTPFPTHAHIKLAATKLITFGYFQLAVAWPKRWPYIRFPSAFKAQAAKAAPKKEKKKIENRKPSNSEQVLPAKSGGGD